MTQVLIWIHEVCLHPHSPALQAYPDAPRVFVFDAAARVSLKRIAFQYECLLEIPGIEIRTGEVAAELAQAAREFGCQRIVTMESVSPNFQQIRALLAREYQLLVEALAPESFISLAAGEAERLDLKRFSRFWQTIRARALSLNQPFDF
jgi:hypothetical protein